MQLKRIFAFFGLIGVVLSAFGSHYLKKILSEAHLQTWKTASLYLFIHVLAGLYCGHYVTQKRSQYCFLFGIVIFSGSLYVLSILNIPLIGIITPIGGLLFILGWLFLLLDMKQEINKT